ncbi:LysR family transcriptional regulator [Acinetobacter pittii]|uniref:LysR family transcriptional regulator n=1 Tax=Acinetobacter pittii TaxID=48296 RepID=UPI001F4009FC|nr:LysR family transcriptional regulator [Acinetobacter pittii]MCE6234830.1 LysR family transcriptional regulator [Acinetobacter pittii]MCE6690472.1 LysR family transcriptional regulator [Acinetobacter pittii]MCE6697036.1 LysR family transcriptional regulator [Acinetobacter pittii]
MDLTNSIDIRTLRFFISVYNAQNFSNVARKEDVSASMISRTIQQLEDALGQQLFYRNTRAITPTESGKLFFEYAQKITEQFDEAQKALQDKTIEPSGLVRINAPVFFGQRHIAPWLAGLSERYPRLLIELIQTDEFIDPLRESTDLIFRIGTLTDSSFHARIFATQKYHLAASPQYVAKYGTLDQPTELNQHKCLVYKGFEGPNRWLVRKPAEEWVHYPITPLLSSNNAESLMTAALHGMGIVLFPDWLIGEALKQGHLIKLLPEYEVAIKSQPQHITALYPNVRHPPLNIRAVIDYFAEIYGNTPYWQN